MKKIKMFAVVLATVIGLAMIPDANAVTAKAEEPVTYSVKYFAESEEWRCKANEPFDSENDLGREMYYLYQDIKDGDIVVVYNDSGSNILLDLGDVHLSNLTMYTGCQWSMVKVGSVDNFYGTAGSSCSITGNVTNAYVYLNALSNFNNDVQNLTQYYDPYDGVDGPNIGCNGIVGQFTSRAYSEEKIFYTLYEAKGLLVLDGVLQEGCSYSYEPVAPSANASSTNASSANTTTAASSSSTSEYDDVPKTGQSSVYLWLLGTAVACFAGSWLLRKTSH